MQLAGGLNGDGFVRGKLTNEGLVSPGEAVGALSVLGGYEQRENGALRVELRGTAAGSFDVLNVTGEASVSGTVNISLLDGFLPTAGDAFPVLQATSISGSPTLSGASAGFSLLSSKNALWLYFGALAGDYDRNGKVEAADYMLWAASFGLTGSAAADGDGNGIVDAADYVMWRSNVGRTVFNAAVGSNAFHQQPTPEPRTFPLVLLAAWCFVLGQANGREPGPKSRAGPGV